ncbi:sigma factor G inhibitor Gin [Desulforamulus aquiferis]|uniref:Sigma factor G inhibitor Gin n=1 Tax=Desulforamulus aquiferis TaxID=1397668 RepID=A0AAW7ZEH7_9FIRM|nr:sigma factor G inhibitor Gin [Desulforamulus aquiferis]MDO7788117.1 sigma factor G inhibitor Gin [Desulforamulus aquiferis]
MKQKVECILCGEKLRPHQYGAAVVILGSIICSGCEKRIVNLTCDDPDYEVYSRGLKKIWCCKEA